MEKSSLDLVCGECTFASSHVPSYTWGHSLHVPGGGTARICFPSAWETRGPVLLLRGLLSGRNAQWVPEVQERKGG